MVPSMPRLHLQLSLNKMQKASRGLGAFPGGSLMACTFLFWGQTVPGGKITFTVKLSFAPHPCQHLVPVFCPCFSSAFTTWPAVFPLRSSQWGCKQPATTADLLGERLRGSDRHTRPCGCSQTLVKTSWVTLASDLCGNCVHEEG